MNIHLKRVSLCRVLSVALVWELQQCHRIPRAVCRPANDGRHARNDAVHLEGALKMSGGRRGMRMRVGQWINRCSSRPDKGEEGLV